MIEILNSLPHYAKSIAELRDHIITNLVLIGQIPAPTYHEEERSEYFLERLAEFGVDECTQDDIGNPIGIIRGQSPHLPPIFLVAHIDTVHLPEVEHNYTVAENTMLGAGIADNSLGVAVLLSLPDILKKLDLHLNSDIVLAAPIQSIGKGNLNGIRHLLSHWPVTIRGGICVEGADLGRVSYISDGMMRAEIQCVIPPDRHESRPYPHKNAILVLHEIISQILKMKLPQRPRTDINIGKIEGGIKHGDIPHEAALGFEVRSTEDRMVQSIFTELKDMITGIGHEYEVDLSIGIISETKACNLKYSHPLVKFTFSALEKLGVKPAVGPSESELSAFLSKDIPALTLGVTTARNAQTKNSEVDIEPIFAGIAQIIGVMTAIDRGVCDE